MDAARAAPNQKHFKLELLQVDSYIFENSTTHYRSLLMSRSVRSLSVFSLIIAAQLLSAQGLYEPSKFLRELNAEPDSSARNRVVEKFVADVRSRGEAVIEDSTVYFLYSGDARRVAVAADFNQWKIDADTMARVATTRLFMLSKTFELAARFEYKLVVDSAWILDPTNRRQAMGGHGTNSEVWMPLYRPPPEIEFRAEIPHGRIDSLEIRSRVLKRSHPVLVYVPAEYKRFSRKRYPTIYVMDGGEYLSLALMNNVLDNLIAEKRIPPIIGVFVDPRTNIHDMQTSMRMNDYTLNYSFVKFVADEVNAKLAKRYRMDLRPEQTAVIGASLGGLISTYAAFMRPDVFGLAAAQSPSYWWKKDSLIRIVKRNPKKPVKFYIGTGTMQDAQREASLMARVMREKGYVVRYEEHPEGHNWANWRARISNILTYFFGK